MPEIHVETETEGENGWHYEVRIGEPPDARTLQVSMAWVDYDLWSQGAIQPAHVIRTVIQFVLEQRAATEANEPVPDRFDAAIVRRWYRDADDQIASRL